METNKFINCEGFYKSSKEIGRLELVFYEDEPGIQLYISKELAGKILFNETSQLRGGRLDVADLMILGWPGKLKIQSSDQGE